MRFGHNALDFFFFGEFHYLLRTTLLVKLHYVVVPLPTGSLFVSAYLSGEGVQ
jgi:hypothetical protein